MAYGGLAPVSTEFRDSATPVPWGVLSTALRCLNLTQKWWCELCGKFETIKHAERHRCRGFHISHDLQLLIDSGDADALAALSDHTADTDGWDDEFLPGYASGASDDGDLF